MLTMIDIASFRLPAASGFTGIEFPVVATGQTSRITRLCHCLYHNFNHKRCTHA